MYITRNTGNFDYVPPFCLGNLSLTRALSPVGSIIRVQSSSFRPVRYTDCRPTHKLAAVKLRSLRSDVLFSFASLRRAVVDMNWHYGKQN